MYVGKTSQTLRCRLNNHRNRLKQLCDLYLYNYFSSDGHSLADVSIMPIEEVLVTADDNTNIASKLLEREEFSLWKVAMPFIREKFINTTVSLNQHHSHHIYGSQYPLKWREPVLPGL